MKEQEEEAVDTLNREDNACNVFTPCQVVDAALAGIIAGNARNGHDGVYGGHVDDGAPSPRLRAVLLHHLTGSSLAALQHTEGTSKFATSERGPAFVCLCACLSQERGRERKRESERRGGRKTEKEGHIDDGSPSPCLCAVSLHHLVRCSLAALQHPQGTS
jgi:hypothetical protein